MRLGPSALGPPLAGGGGLARGTLAILCCSPGARFAPELMPVLLAELDVVVARGLLDVGEGQLAIVVRDASRLVEARDGVAHVARVGQRLLTVLGERKDAVRQVAALGERSVLLMRLPGGLHRRLQTLRLAPFLDQSTRQRAVPPAPRASSSARLERGAAGARAGRPCGSRTRDRRDVLPRAPRSPLRRRPGPRAFAPARAPLSRGRRSDAPRTARRGRRRAWGSRPPRRPPSRLRRAAPAPRR